MFLASASLCRSLCSLRLRRFRQSIFLCVTVGNLFLLCAGC